MEDNYFIKRTANDYDLSYEIVEEIYKKSSGNYEKFYEYLEEIIKKSDYLQC